MSISDKRNALWRAVVYLGITVICVIFFLVYNQFSHGVHSPFMTYMFVVPLVLGFIPSLVFLKIRRQPGRSVQNLWNSGVASLTVSSGLRGVFEIAGTSSGYRVWLTIAGVLLIIIGAACYYREK